MGTSVFANAGYNGTTLNDGLACLNANTGSTSVNNLSGSTVKWKASTAFGGSWAVEVINASGQAANLRLPFDVSSNTVSFAYDFICPALPAGGGAWETIATTRAGSTVVVISQIDPNGKLAMFCAGTQLPNSTQPGGGTPTALTPGSKYRLEVTVAGSATVATGTVSGRIFAYAEPTTTNYICGTTSASAATGTTAFTHCDIGLGAHATIFTLDYSNVRLVSGSASWLGPYTATTPSFDFTYAISPSTINSGDTVTISAARVVGTGTGTTMTLAIDWGDGTSTPAQTTLSASHVYTPSVTTDEPVSITCVLT